MWRRTPVSRVRNPVPDDTKAFYTWFSANLYRQEVSAPGGYPAVRIYPVYGKRWVSGRTMMTIMASCSLYGAWCRPERDRYNYEMEMELHERHAAHLPYQQAEVHLRMLVTAYKRHRYEKELLLDKGYAGLTTEFRKFFYHDDVWRPDLHDVFKHPYIKYGGAFMSYNWAHGYW
jgi:hypothetical protein